MALKSIAAFSVGFDHHTGQEILVLHRADGGWYHVKFQSHEELSQVVDKISQKRPLQFDTETGEIFTNFQPAFSATERYGVSEAANRTPRCSVVRPVRLSETK